ncbi:MAG: hypothetical protein ABI831_14370 [Betaproteobacteria bacterium]
MGIFDRFNPADKSRGRTYEGQRTEPSEDEQALARYRYMLKTAPPETIEQAHAEAFAKLTPEQRRLLLEQLRAEVPEAERAYAAENPQALARLATRAEMRQPGILERLFGRVPTAAAPGFGGMIAGSLLGSVAGTVLGTMIAQNFLGSHGDPGHGHGAGDVHGAEYAPGAGADTSDMAGGLDDFGGGFDGGSFDV